MGKNESDKKLNLDQISILKIREEFIEAASHELKTPVTILKSFIYSIQSLIKNKTNLNQTDIQKLSDALEFMSLSTDRINELSQDLTNFANAQKDSLSFKKEEIDLGKLVKQLILQNQIALSDHPIFIKVSSTFVYGDLHLTSIAISNLLNHATTYGQDDMNIYLRVRQKDGKGMVSISYHGNPIEEDRKLLAFEPMGEMHPPGSLGYKGVIGLKLAFSKLVIEKQGGKIWVESTSEGFNSFCINLPVVKKLKKRLKKINSVVYAHNIPRK